MKLEQAIAHIEGFYAAGGGNRPQRNNNPGNLEFEFWMVGKYGATLETGTAHPRFAHFPDAETGFQALRDLLSGSHYSGLTIEAAINRYAPPTENNTAGYVAYVCREVGCAPSALVRDVLAESVAV